MLNTYREEFIQQNVEWSVCGLRRRIHEEKDDQQWEKSRPKVRTETTSVAHVSNHSCRLATYVQNRRCRVIVTVANGPVADRSGFDRSCSVEVAMALDWSLSQIVGQFEYVLPRVVSAVHERNRSLKEKTKADDGRERRISTYIEHVRNGMDWHRYHHDDSEMHADNNRQVSVRSDEKHRANAKVDRGQRHNWISTNGYVKAHRMTWRTETSRCLSQILLRTNYFGTMTHLVFESRCKIAFSSSSIAFARLYLVRVLTKALIFFSAWWFNSTRLAADADADGRAFWLSCCCCW